MSAPITRAQAPAQAKRAERGLARKRRLPPLVLPVDLLAEPVNEMAVPVLEAARLVDTSEQNLHQAVNRGTLPAYQWSGRRMILLADLVDSPAGRKQAERVAEESSRLAWARERHANPWPAGMWPEGEPLCPPDCPVCLENEPTDAPEESSS